MPDNDADVVMTVPEVAEFLKLTESTIYRLARTDQLPARKVGGVWRFSRQALDRWLSTWPKEDGSHDSRDSG